MSETLNKALMEASDGVASRLAQMLAEGTLSPFMAVLVGGHVNLGLRPKMALTGSKGAKTLVVAEPLRMSLCEGTFLASPQAQAPELAEPVPAGTIMFTHVKHPASDRSGRTYVSSCRTDLDGMAPTLLAVRNRVNEALTVAFPDKVAVAGKASGSADVLSQVAADLASANIAVREVAIDRGFAHGMTPDAMKAILTRHGHDVSTLG